MRESPEHPMENRPKRFCAECCRPRRRSQTRRMVVSVLCIGCRFRHWRRDLLSRLGQVLGVC